VWSKTEVRTHKGGRLTAVVEHLPALRLRLRKTLQKGLSAKFGELKQELRRRWDQPITEAGSD